MSIKIMNLVMGSTLPGASRRWLLTALADRADDRGFCWPGVTNLVLKTGLSRATVFRLLKDFENESLIQRRPWYKPSGAQDTNRYRINIEMLGHMQRPDSKDDGCDELEGMFEKFPPSHSETPPASRDETPPVSVQDCPPSHSETPARRVVTPNTSVDPSPDPSLEQTTAREAVTVESASLFPIDGPSGLAPDEAAAEWDAKQRRRSRSVQAMERLNATRHRPAAVAIVARFEQRTHRLSRTEKGKWWSAVSNLIDLEYPDSIIDAALDQCVADGVGYGLLESKALLVANRPKFAAQSKLATSDRRSNEIDALFDQRAAAGYGSAAQVVRPEIEAPR